MRIAVDISSLQFGGKERQVTDLAVGLAERGDDVVVVVNKSATAFLDRLRRPGIDVVELHREGRFDARVLPGIRRVLREFRPDVLLCVNFNATMWGRLAALGTGVPVVTAEHSTTRPVARPEIGLSNRILAPMTAAVVACASAQVPDLVAEGNPGDRVAVIHNGVDPDVFRRDEDLSSAVRDEWGIALDALAIGLCGAHRVEKRHDRFIRLVETLNDRGLSVHGVMVGGGELLEADRARAAASPSAAMLHVPGASEDMPAVYGALDVCVLTSDAEAFPFAFLEAQACETPVAGFDVGGARETLAEGESGFLVPADDEAALADAVEALLSDPERRRAAGAAGRRLVVGSHTVARMVDEYRALFARVSGVSS